MTATIAERRFTVDEYHRMAEAGILGEDDQVELLDGRVFEKHAPGGPRHRRFTIEEYHRMAEAGILHEDDRVELLDGRIVQTTPIGHRHAACVDLCNRWASARLASRAFIRIQSPVQVEAGSEPQPDVAVLRLREDDYLEGPAVASDCYLVIEVTDTSQTGDREVKLPLYAGAGVPEVWIIDLAADRIEVYREPTDGRYTETSTRGAEEQLAPRRFPEETVRAGWLFGK